MDTLGDMQITYTAASVGLGSLTIPGTLRNGELKEPFIKAEILKSN